MTFIHNQRSGVGAFMHTVERFFRFSAVNLVPGVYRGKLHDVAVEKWQIVDDSVKQNLARMASTAAWGLG